MPPTVNVQVTQLAAPAPQLRQAALEQTQVLVTLRVYPDAHVEQLLAIVQVAQVDKQGKHEPPLR